MSRWVIVPYAALLTLSSLPNHRQSRMACSRPPLLRALTASYEPRYSTLRSYLTRSSRRQKRCWRSRRCVCVEQQKLAHLSALFVSQKRDHVFPPFGVKTCRAHLFHILSQNVSRASFPHFVSKRVARIFFRTRRTHTSCRGVEGLRSRSSEDTSRGTYHTMLTHRTPPERDPNEISQDWRDSSAGVIGHHDDELCITNCDHVPCAHTHTHV